MPVMKLASDLSQCTSEERAKCLFFAGCNITQNTDVLGENVLTSTENSDRSNTSWRKSWSIWGDVINSHLFELGENTANFEAFFEVVVLVCVDKLDVFTAIKDDSVVLIIALSISKNRVARELNAEFGSAHAIFHDLAVSINQGRIKTWFLALTYRWFLIKISNLQIRISPEDKLGIFTLFLCELGVSLHRDDKFEFPTCHTLEFAIELVRITSKHLHDFWVLNPVEKFDSTGIVHETGDGTVKSL